MNALYVMVWLPWYTMLFMLMMFVGGLYSRSAKIATKYATFPNFGLTMKMKYSPEIMRSLFNF